MERLSGLDASFLYVETPTMHMHVALIAVLDPVATGQGYDYERVHQLIEREARRLPQLKKRLVEVPLRIEHPLWIEDPHFDVIHHVRRVACPAPGSMNELADLAARIISTPLDRARPLWELWVVEGLEQGRYALVAKVHHAIADGMTGASLLASMFSLTPDAPPRPAHASIRPVQELPSELELLRAGLASRIQKPRELVRLFRRTSNALLDLYERRQSGQHRAGASPLDAPRTRWNAPIVAQRTAAFAQVPLAELKLVRKAFGATINDVVLAVCAGTLRRYLLERNELPQAPLVAACPVAVRARGTGHNKVSAMFTSLATHVEDPVERLAAIRAITRGAKEEHNALGGDMLGSWAELASPSMFSLAARLYTRYRLADKHRPLYNVAISNVPGPRIPIYFAGAKLVAAYPLGPVVEGVGLNITVMTYSEQVDFGFVSTTNLLPDLPHMAALVPEATSELVTRARDALASPRPNVEMDS